MGSTTKVIVWKLWILRKVAGAKLLRTTRPHVEHVPGMLENAFALCPKITASDHSGMKQSSQRFTPPCAVTAGAGPACCQFSCAIHFQLWRQQAYLAKFIGIILVSVMYVASVGELSCILSSYCQNQVGNEKWYIWWVQKMNLKNLNTIISGSEGLTFRVHFGSKTMLGIRGQLKQSNLKNCALLKGRKQNPNPHLRISEKLQGVHAVIVGRIFV